MELHIYNTELNPGDIVVITGDVNKNDINSVRNYVQVLRAAFPDHPVVFVPDKTTFDTMSPDNFMKMLQDTIDPDVLKEWLEAVTRATQEGIDDEV